MRAVLVLLVACTAGRGARESADAPGGIDARLDAIDARADASIDAAFDAHPDARPDAPPPIDAAVPPDAPPVAPAAIQVTVKVVSPDAPTTGGHGTFQSPIHLCDFQLTGLVVAPEHFDGRHHAEPPDILQLLPGDHVCADAELTAGITLQGAG